MDKKQIIARLAEIVGPEYVSDEPFILLSYTQDFGAEAPRWPAIVVKPGTLG